jgi:hypothetical protein
MKVTFDTNVLTRAVSPDLCSGQPNHDHAACVAVHEALKTGRIKGYFSEAVVALDVLGKEAKVAAVGGARIGSEMAATGPKRVTISIGTRWPRTSIHPKSLELIRSAQKLGMKALIGPRYLGNSLSVRGFGEDFYEDYVSPADVVTRGGKTNEVEAALRQRGVGRARAVELGLTYSERDNASGEFWMQGLGRARDTERRKVLEAINEWADGDAIAAHVGYSNDLFCTHDRGGSSGQCSVLHPSKRAWLRSTYGIEFVTLSELTERLGR